MSNETQAADRQPQAGSTLRLSHPAIGYLLLAVLAGVFLFGGSNLPFGSLASIGPGFLPKVLASLLLVMSLAGIAMELRRGRAGNGLTDLRPLFFICLAILVFALTVRRIGLIPASVLSAFVAGLAEKDMRLAGNAVVAVLIGGLVWLIFVAGLGLSVASFRSPF